MLALSFQVSGFRPSRGLTLSLTENRKLKTADTSVLPHLPTFALFTFLRFTLHLLSA